MFFGVKVGFLLILVALIIDQNALAQSVSVDVLHILSEGPDYIIDQPNDASANENGIIAVAELRQAKVLIFNEKGDFIRAIGRRGNGPGEFQMVYHIELIGDRLFTFDFQLQRISLFDVNTGNIIRTIPYKDIFGHHTPVRTSSSKIDGDNVLIVLLSDQVKFETGVVAPLRIVSISDELELLENETLGSVDLISLMDKGKEYAVSYFRPVNNFSFVYRNEMLYIAPYIFDGAILQWSASIETKTARPHIVRDPSINAGLSNNILKSMADRDAMVRNRAIIGGIGSSPWGGLYYYIPRHSLRLFTFENSLLHLFSEYDNSRDNYSVHFSFINAQGGNVTTSGRAQLRKNGSTKDIFNARRLYAINANGIGVMMIFDDDELRLCIVKVSVIK